MKRFIKSITIILFFSIWAISSAQNQKANLRINQGLILQVYDSTKITKINGSFSLSDINFKRYLRIETGNKKILRGYLMAYNNHGLFIANKINTQFMYCDYKHINKVYFGRSYGNWVAVSTALASGITTMLAFIGGESIYSIGWGFAAGITTATYGQIGTGLAYGIYKNVKNCHWQIYYQRKNGMKLTEYINEYNNLFDNIDNVTSWTNIKQKITNETITTSDTVNTNQTPQGTTNTPNDSLPIKSTVIKPQSKVTYLEGLPLEKNGGLSIEWVLKNFDPKSVNEGTLMKDFKNLKGIQITQNQLLKLNTSSLQFLALIICESGGYDIKALLKLTDKQIKEIVFYEPSIVDPVTPQSVIDKSYISEIDLQNLQVIYSELKSR